MQIHNWKILGYFCLLTCLMSCAQSDPIEVITAPKGDITFSGYAWRYKNQPNPVGPGPNRFLGTKDNAWVDTDGKLHMKISKKNNLWYCSEIISEKVFGYGTYVFTSESDIRDFDQKAVFGFFTWDDYSFQKQGNSEIDIEFSKWDIPSDSLLVTYSVQPVWFSQPAPYQERTRKPLISPKYISKSLTHMMRWTPDGVTWESYEGETYPGTNKVAEWSFDKTNRSRNKIEGNRISDAIVIPAPSDSTNFRFNFWLLNGVAPNNGKEHEIVVKNFRYTPL
jgi:hypothetical protein